jgi:hypothetical protein
VTNSQQPATPPGWYPVAAGQSLQRYWDGTAWTEHTYDPAPAPLRAPEGTNPTTVWVWLLAIAAPLVEFALLQFEFSWFTSFANADFSDPSSLYSQIYTPSYFVLIAGSWVLYAALVVVGWLDYRRLRALGVPRPFHWAWSFLSGIVYMIGRSVVVKRRTGTGLTPLWFFIALEALFFVGTLVVTIYLIGQLFQNIASAYPV